jgi:hypothetical protein
VFVVPCHGRHKIAAACLRQLSRTCEQLAATIGATAVLISNEPRFERLARELGFAHVSQTNQPLGRKWNDGIEHAVNELDADYVVPFGSDDIVDPALIAARLPREGEIGCSRLSTVVSEDGRRLAHLNITYRGGDGVRTIPVSMLAKVGCRPAEDDRDRAMDTSMQRKLMAAGVRPRLEYLDLHPLQLVDFKSRAGQLNDYAGCSLHYGTHESATVWSDLAEVYPAEFVDEMQRVYRSAR